MNRRPYRTFAIAALVLAAGACDDDPMQPPLPDPLDPATAPRVAVDRFSDDAAALFRRSDEPSLPGPNEPIDMDQAPFITVGLGSNGEPVRYYNFDVQSAEPAPIYVLFADGASSPVAGQLNIVGVIPGDAGYNDFWQVVRVTVPADYVANTITSEAALLAEGFTMETTTTLVNCPIVPDGSVAREGGGADGLTMGWYDDQVVFYLNFGEAPLTATADGMVPTAPIHVTFNVNPDETDGGPPSGFMTQGSSDQTHNVLHANPGEAGYSPLWDVIPYDNSFFDQVHDRESAEAADDFGSAALVNCPVVFVGEAPGDPGSATRASIDRFSDEAATLFRRSDNAALPAADAAIDMDVGPFITMGLGPDGNAVRYYNFDVQPREPAPIYVLFHESGDAVAGQLNIVDVIPGETGYNDFWRVVRVTVPDGYIANTATSVQDLEDLGFPQEETTTLVNCPIVPAGSVAQEGGGADGLTLGWHDGELIHYFNFGEAPLEPTTSGEVPTSPIFVTFNINPEEPGGGPGSGFMTEPGTEQTHNVVATLPDQTGYSPLWEVFVYDNADFDEVSDLASAQAATIFGMAAFVNCPVVFVQ